ncbi:nucleoside triphosphate pyrophosphohydrolase [Brevibacillus brevis]|uniref:nucleoside triphosphate pyrophosphohydrolase n=1 Tax=Brevibacillus brevis TaxID=1393 RepID=UPI0025A50497|nr:nucleoside triphosphate pyrophosphohydrolase [Brevibacillus brevis]WJQ82612.1 nucleoside triphosphate pyrophosphohydrolase [Brevibacillus brevis]
MIVYNKLIRDKIPQIMKEKGKEFTVHKLSNEQFETELKNKLSEELQEFNQATPQEEIEELADMVEVIYAYLKYKGVSINEFEKIRLNKQEKRGGFEEKLFLVDVKE